MGELIFLALIGIVGVLCYNETLSYSVAEYDRTGGPAMYPQLVLILLFIALALRAIQILMTKEKPKFKWFTLFKGSRGVFFIAFALFVFLMDPLGFIVDATLFLTGTSLYLYIRISIGQDPGRREGHNTEGGALRRLQHGGVPVLHQRTERRSAEGILGFLF